MNNTETPEKPENLAQTNISNERLTLILLHKISTLKSAYTTSITTLETLCTAFTNTHTIPTLTTLLPQCTTTSQISRLHQTYTSNLTTHTQTLKSHLAAAVGEFKNGVAALRAAKAGPGKDAWEGVREAKGEGFERFMEGFGGRVEEVQREVRDGAARVKEECWAHGEEMGLVEGVERMLGGMKVRVRAEVG